MYNDVKIFIGPMSKDVVDAVIDYAKDCKTPLGLIPSRRQVDHTGGYVNNWTTEEFCNYVRSKTNNVLLVRDHGGPGQGANDDDGLDSFKQDCQPGMMDVVYVDVWKKYPELAEGSAKTIEFIKLGYSINPEVMYEVGTEEAIRPMTSEDLDCLLANLKDGLTEEEFGQIKWSVIQSGTALKGNVNTGDYNQDRLKDMVSVAHHWNTIAKEHNGDYLSNDLVRKKFTSGLDCINIAPEFGQLQTKTILKDITAADPTLIEEFYQICYNSKKWVKWVDEDFVPSKNKLELINICGHYVFSTPEFKELKNNVLSLNDIDWVLTRKIGDLVSASSITYYETVMLYFERFSDKDLFWLKRNFADDVTLRDWDISAEGKEKVLEANANIFNGVDSIEVTLLDYYYDDHKSVIAAEIEILVNKEETLKVVDIIELNYYKKIKAIRAYKG